MSQCCNLSAVGATEAEGQITLLLYTDEQMI